ncbi:hypothetical protein GCM10025864_43750 [Luteimicrobium album]|uniref:Uncharacterized protein n=1 Tax=Luteimicrobium album TaxID=1054550 RepID=A0ABQ6I7E5_9MICO|nr:hypothetical protein [Luteimicrobium album]GMA26616.1 hypothetical protein GCM10025864_43750 [Luteimicrobium album]
MKPFRATRRGYVAQLDTPERVVLAHVVGDVVELLQEAVPDADGSPWGTLEADAPPRPGTRRWRGCCRRRRRTRTCRRSSDG